MKESIVIFGASTLGEVAYRVLVKEFEIVCFSDNDSRKWGSIFCGIPVRPPEQIFDVEAGTVVVASMYSDEISAQLKKMGEKKIYIFVYSDIKDTGYQKKYRLDSVCDWERYKGLEIQSGKTLIGYYQKFLVGRNPNKQKRKKKVLIVAYIFPPIGGSGVQRTLKFVKYLREFGYEPIVVVAGKTFFELEYDETMLAEIPLETEIFRVDDLYYSPDTMDRERIQKTLSLICGVLEDPSLQREYIDCVASEDGSRRNLILMPDNKISWVSEVLDRMVPVLSDRDFDLIYTTSDPYSDHLIGFYLQKIFNKPWVADFRDEWSTNPHLPHEKESTRYRLIREIEEKMIKEADRVITVSPLSTQSYRRRVRGSSILTITNGYDEEDFQCLDEEKRDHGTFKIVFNGRMYPERFPKEFFSALNDLIRENFIEKEKVQILLNGKQWGSVERLVREYDENRIVRINGYQAHSDSLEVILAADLLLTPVGKGSEYNNVYTGKIFEYIRTGNPVLALAPTDGVLAELLKETRAGITCEMDDYEAIREALISSYTHWSEREVLCRVDREKIRKYERRNLTEKLALVFDELLEERKLEKQ